MTIEQKEVVDFLGIHEASGAVRMAISDHLEWSDDNHLSLLNEKLNAYVDFVRNQMPDEYPDYVGKPIEIYLGCMYQPDTESQARLENVRRTLEEMGISFFWRVSKSNEDAED